MTRFFSKTCLSPGHGCPYYPGNRRWNRVRPQCSLGWSHSSRRYCHPAPFSFSSYLPQRAPLTVLPVVLILYSALAAEFLLRFSSDRPMRSIREKGVSLPRGTVDKSMQLMLIGMSIMIILLLIRSVYRIVQLSGGWRGKVMAIQWLFGSSPCRLPASPSLLFSYRDADCENRRV